MFVDYTIWLMNTILYNISTNEKAALIAENCTLQLGLSGAIDKDGPLWNGEGDKLGWQ